MKQRISKNKPLSTMLLIIGVVAVSIALFLSGYLASNRRVAQTEYVPTIVPTSTELLIPTQQATQKQIPSPAPTSKPIRIPSDWKPFSVYDKGYNIEIRGFMPPGFTYNFTGSESMIQNDDVSELWEVRTSIFMGWDMSCKRGIPSNDAVKCCVDTAQNYFSGESRRAWYARYLNGDFSCNTPQSSFGSIQRVTERSIGTGSYLEVLAKMNFSENPVTNYVIERGGVIFMIIPSSDQAMSSSAVLPKHMGMVLYTMSAVRK